MALLSLGRNVVIDERLRRPDLEGDTADDVRKKVEDQLEDARKGLLHTLNPWIPGDFVITYGLLLSAWPLLRDSFIWLLVVAGGSAFTFVILGAFAATGFARRRDRSKKVWRRLLIRTGVGFTVSVYASVAIPMSGWREFSWFTENELAWLVTATALAAVIVMIMKGLQKLGILTQ